MPCFQTAAIRAFWSGPGATIVLFPISSLHTSPPLCACALGVLSLSCWSQGPLSIVFLSCPLVTSPLKHVHRPVGRDELVFVLLLPRSSWPQRSCILMTCLDVPPGSMQKIHVQSCRWGYLSWLSTHEWGDDKKRSSPDAAVIVEWVSAADHCSPSTALRMLL